MLEESFVQYLLIGGVALVGVAVYLLIFKPFKKKGELTTPFDKKPMLSYAGRGGVGYLSRITEFRKGEGLNYDIVLSNGVLLKGVNIEKNIHIPHNDWRVIACDEPMFYCNKDATGETYEWNYVKIESQSEILDETMRQMREHLKQEIAEYKELGSLTQPRSSLPAGKKSYDESGGE